MEKNNNEEKLVNQTGELISSLTDKIKDIDSSSIKKIIDDKNSAALGLIVCCTATSTAKETPKKAKKSKKR